MGFLLEITEKKAEKLSEHIEQSLKHMGKAMQCVEEWMDDSEMGHRGGYGMRGNYNSRYSGGGSYMGNRYGEHDDEDWEEMSERYDDEMYGERRGRRRRDSRGRYM